MSSSSNRADNDLREYDLTELRWKLRDARDDLLEIAHELQEASGEEAYWWQECQRACELKIAELEAEFRRRCPTA